MISFIALFTLVQGADTVDLRSTARVAVGAAFEEAQIRVPQLRRSRVVVVQGESFAAAAGDRSEDRLEQWSAIASSVGPRGRARMPEGGLQPGDARVLTTSIVREDSIVTLRIWMGWEPSRPGKMDGGSIEMIVKVCQRASGPEVVEVIRGAIS